eukprot:SAG11_NODE_123_length_15805_cov_15.133261_5_plen_127_part_00
MLSYLRNVSAAGPPARCVARDSNAPRKLAYRFPIEADGVFSGLLNSGELYTAQCLWQETPDSIAVGELRGSSLLADEARSGLNAELRRWAGRGGQWDVGQIGLVEVNNVCDGGNALLEALRALPNR